MFNILKFSPDQITGITEIRVTVQLKSKGNIIDDGGYFKTKNEAEAWLIGLKKYYLTVRVENYINHKKYIIESGNGHKSLSAKKIALITLQNYLGWACKNSDLNEVCKYLLQIQDKFEAVLPSKKNPSYHSSTDELKLITDFAKAHHTAQLKKAS